MGEHRWNHPPLAEGVVAREISYGIFDNAANWDIFIQKNMLLTKFAVGNVNLHPFIKGEPPGSPPLARAWVVGRLVAKLRVAFRGQKDDQLEETVAIGEMLAPNLPDHFFMDQARSREAIEKITRSAFGWSPFAGSVTSVEWFSITNEIYQAISGEHEFDGTNETRHGLPDHWPWNPAEGNALDARRYLQLLFLLAGYLRHDTTSTMGLQMIVTVMVAAVKQGNATSRYINKVTQGVHDDLTVDITLDSLVISQVHKKLLLEVDETCISRLLEEWHTRLPVDALRLRLVIEQAGGTGLTVLTTIGKAIKSYPTFPWHRVEALLPNQWTAAVQAIAAVGNNPWYGYKKNLGAVSSTRYKDIGYICKELLLKIGGDSNLTAYKGWPRRPSHQDTLDRWIECYREALVAATGLEEFALVADDRPVAIRDILGAANTIYG